MGRKGLDDGLVLFVFPQDQKVRIEVGYGLEDKVPDAIASRIIRETIVPRIQAGDSNGAVVAGVQALMNAIQPPEAGTVRDEAPEPVGQPGGSEPLSPLEMIGLGILGPRLPLAPHHPSLHRPLPPLQPPVGGTRRRWRWSVVAVDSPVAAVVVAAAAPRGRGSGE